MGRVALPRSAHSPITVLRNAAEVSAMGWRLIRMRSGSRPVTEADVSHRNCFNTLRLGAAVAVLVSHSFAVVARHEPSVGTNTVGRVAVLVFFVISGFLITQSWLREPRLGRYLLKRGLRIFPALVAVLGLTALVLGPIVTTLPGGSYLHSYGTWSYIFQNTAFRTVYELPGVFGGNAHPRAVNASLWTLPVEVHAYLMVAALGLLSVLRTRAAAVAAFVAVGLISFSAPHPTEAVLGAPDLVRAFAAGALLFLWRDRIPWRAWIAASLVVAWLLLANSGRIGQGLAIAAVAYTTVLVAHHGPDILRRLTHRRDVSYGIYLWAFPVQQTTALVLRGITPLEMMAVALPITSVLALASWTVIERPALRLKSIGLRGLPAAARTLVPVSSRPAHPAAAMGVVGPERPRSDGP